MPELPEVETTLQGIRPHISQKKISDVVVRNSSLRWPVPEKELASSIGQTVTRVYRRGKYLLLETSLGSILLHLGMSGSIRILDSKVNPEKHDHIDIVFNSQVLRFNDPRRFGCCLWVVGDALEHKLLVKLGPEPLSDDFDSEMLFAKSRGRVVNIKTFIMNSSVVVGVGNIYASEALFRAGIRPSLKVGKVSKARYQVLASEIKSVLAEAIKAGGTTLNDFTKADGKPGYFQQSLLVYGRAGESCDQCGTEIKSQVIAQRNTFYCSECQRF